MMCSGVLIFVVTDLFLDRSYPVLVLLEGLIELQEWLKHLVVLLGLVKVEDLHVECDWGN